MIFIAHAAFISIGHLVQLKPYVYRTILNIKIFSHVWLFHGFLMIFTESFSEP